MSGPSPTPVSTWDYEHPLPVWLALTQAGSRSSSMKRASKIEALGVEVPKPLECVKCSMRAWKCKVLLGEKSMRCARCTNSNLVCTLTSGGTKKAVEDHFRDLETARKAREQEAAGQAAIRGVEESAEAYEELMKEGEQEEIGEDTVEQEMDEPAGDEDEIDEEEEEYYANQERLRESTLRYLVRKGYWQEVHNLRRQPITPYSRN